MLGAHNVLFLDEPTNHLDIPAKETLEDALRHFDGTVFVVSHDRYFVDKVSSQLVERSTASPEQAPGTCPQVCSQLFVLGGDGDVRRWPDSFTRWVEWYRLQDQQRAF